MSYVKRWARRSRCGRSCHYVPFMFSCGHGTSQSIPSRRNHPRGPRLGACRYHGASQSSSGRRCPRTRPRHLRGRRKTFRGSRRRPARVVAVTWAAGRKTGSGVRPTSSRPRHGIRQLSRCVAVGTARPSTPTACGGNFSARCGTTTSTRRGIVSGVRDAKRGRGGACALSGWNSSSRASTTSSCLCPMSASGSAR